MNETSEFFSFYVCTPSQDYIPQGNQKGLDRESYLTEIFPNTIVIIYSKFNYLH